jgi:hypothetical protein
MQKRDMLQGYHKGNWTLIPLPCLAQKLNFCMGKLVRTDKTRHRHAHACMHTHHTPTPPHIHTPTHKYTHINTQILTQTPRHCHTYTGGGPKKCTRRRERGRGHCTRDKRCCNNFWQSVMVFAPTAAVWPSFRRLKVILVTDAVGAYQNICTATRPMFGPYVQSPVRRSAVIQGPASVNCNSRKNTVFHRTRASAFQTLPV